MGKRAEEALDIATIDDLKTYLRVSHAAYMQVGVYTYYLTDVNSHAWRVQDTNELNEKAHYVDCSDLVPTIDEFLHVPFTDEGESIEDLFADATFFASEGSVKDFD
ncbi:CDP-alcohol phosphatidyltransferase [Denitrobacterium detoxificans]|jgi:hypothetical protein|uniref:CDP-alcohol phosphatidyltransferase n=1 Tax=Denitrobacterium detoxificans TaxID=79604 RepID=UPI0026EDB935|nr:CDP-alcohol phosphatidyltransferase [Denitrobacterium detoxificans]MBE6465610.1 CDP-alcohol phosphatidyltransferase [Denitrobacterium detoxificans]